MEVDCRTVKSKQDASEPFVFLDVREQQEFDCASLPGSTLIPMSEIQERVTELEQHKEDEIIVFCHAGVRSRQVMM